MLLYEHDRTEKIVERLRNAEGIIRLITVVSAITLFGLSGMSVGAVTRSIETLTIGAIIGAILGLIVGNFSMILLSAAIEWMCQMLIAQGEVLDACKRIRKS